MKHSVLAESFHRCVKESLNYNQHGIMDNFTDDERKVINERIADALADCFQTLDPSTDNLAKSQKSLLDVLEHVSITLHSIKEGIMSELNIKQTNN